MLIPSAKSFEALCLVSAAYGVTMGALWALIPVISSDLFIEADMTKVIECAFLVLWCYDAMSILSCSSLRYMRRIDCHLTLPSHSSQPLFEIMIGAWHRVYCSVAVGADRASHCSLGAKLVIVHRFVSHHVIKIYVRQSTYFSHLVTFLYSGLCVIAAGLIFMVLMDMKRFVGVLEHFPALNHRDSFSCGPFSI